ncbi:unnamed protein product, partial [Porites lobata]
WYNGRRAKQPGYKINILNFILLMNTFNNTAKGYCFAALYCTLETSVAAERERLFLETRLLAIYHQEKLKSYFLPLRNRMPCCKEVEILEVTFKCDSKFSVHNTAQRGLQDLLNSYALSVYAASESDLIPVQCFLDRCFKPVSVYDFLERQDRKMFRKFLNKC